MEAGVGGGGGELDGSLFEGMILFSPADLLPSDPLLEKEPDVPSPSQDSIHPPPSPPPPYSPQNPSPSPPTTSAASANSKTQPLDVDLFSDLALQIPNEPAGRLLPVESDPVPVPSSSMAAPSRQISRKKKRSLRVGYGREASDMTPVVSVDDPPHLTQNGTFAVSSDYAPSTTGHNDELPDRSMLEEVEEVKVAVGETAAADGGGLSAPGLTKPEAHVEVVTMSEDDCEKGDSLESIEEKLNVLRSEISAKLQHIREMATSLYAERKELERRRRKVGQDVSQAEATYKDLEEQLEEACEDEEFERAERVSESLAAIEKEKERLLNTLKEMELDCDSVDSRMQELLKQHIAVEEEGVVSLEQFSKDAIAQADLIFRNAEEVSSKELDDWQSSMELLEINKLEIEIEAELISDARSELDSSIEDLVKEDRKEIEGLMNKRVCLATELEELLNLVRLKEAEIADNEFQIQEVEKKMTEVASDFQEASSSVSMKHDRLKSAMSRMYTEHERLSSEKNEIDRFVSLAEQKCFTYKGLASAALNEAKAFQDLVGFRKQLAASMLEFRECKVQLVRTEEKVLEDIQILRQQISTGRTALQELSSSRVSIQQGIDSFKQRKAFVDKRVPELESEKKISAAARNFKEAGRIAAEAKALSSEKESLQRKIEKAALDLEKLEGEIEEIVRRIQASEELVALKEKEAAVASFRRLQLIAAAERSAALELRDAEEGEFLLKEAEALERRAKELQEAYSLDPMDGQMMSKHFFPASLITAFSDQISRNGEKMLL